MKRMTPEVVRKKNLRALYLCIASLIVTVILLSLPIYQFSTSLYIKKSGNTFVGDERYVAARAEADAAAAQYQAEYNDVTVTEQVTQRVNSKGETTSLITFRVGTVVTRNGWAFVASGLPSGRLLLAALLAVLASVLLVLASLPGTLQAVPGRLSRRTAAMRKTAGYLALLALLLVPAFHFYTVHMFQREIIAQQATGDRLAALLGAADAFLYGGRAGDTTGTLLASIEYHSTIWLWLMLPAMFLLLVETIRLTAESLGRVLARGCLYLFVIAMCVMILYPYYVMLVTAFRNNAEATDMYFNHIFPTKWVWSNITDIVNRNVPRFLLNSLMLSTGATVIALLCGIPAAYAMARMRFRGKKAFLGFVIMSQMFAPIVLLVGISQLMTFLKLNDTILGLMLINAAFNQAFAIWLLRGTFVAISPEMEQAASIDGCGIGGALLHVLLPMAAPGIVTTLIFVFINSWNEYTISTVLISSPLKKPITVGITQFSSFNMIEWQYLFASALLATIPVVILFMFIEKHLVAGLTSGGVKG
ncbi:MAG: carbohydrate ABC transporter permease [Eubacteriales bacterium]|nr:carbohydrate ABC transporter permease [Eubacteriales bacterium]